MLYRRSLRAKDDLIKMRRWIWVPGAILLILYSAYMLKAEYTHANTLYVAPAFFGYASSLMAGLYFLVIPLLRLNKFTIAVGSVLAAASTSLAGAAISDLWRQSQMSGETIFQQPVDSLFPSLAAALLALVVILRLAYIDSNLTKRNMVD